MTHAEGKLRAVHGSRDFPSSTLEADGQFICQTVGGNDKTNANRLALCWNSHDALLEALDKILSLRAVEILFDAACTDPNGTDEAKEIKEVFGAALMARANARSKP